MIYLVLLIGKRYIKKKKKKKKKATLLTPQLIKPNNKRIRKVSLTKKSSPNSLKTSTSTLYTNTKTCGERLISTSSCIPL